MNGSESINDELKVQSVPNVDWSKVMLTINLCNSIRNSIDIIDKVRETRDPDGIQSLRQKYRGIRTGEKIKLFLTGGFSGGKTTFIRRILEGTVVGAISGVPQTSTIIKHYGGYAGSFKVVFNEKYAPPSAQKQPFSKFLKTYDIDSCFEQSGDIWKAIEREKVFDVWGYEKCLDFLKGSDSFPAFIKIIEWSHKLATNKKWNVLDFFEIFDLPGIGGTETHNNIIENIIKESQPDIILCLLNSTSGIPEGNEYDYIVSWTKTAIARENQLFFVWVYQKSTSPTSGPKKDWIKEQKEQLCMALDEITKVRKLDNDTITLLKESNVIDARGDSEESNIALSAITKILGLYFEKKTRAYIEECKKNIGEIPQLPAILFNTKGNARLPQNPLKLLTGMLEELSWEQRKDKLNTNEAKSRIEEKLCLSAWDENKQKEELQLIMRFFREKIEETIEAIMTRVTYHKRSFTEDIVEGIEKVFKADSKKTDAFICDLNYLRSGFKEELSTNQEWQKNIIFAQAAFLLNAFYQKNLPGYYLKDFESKIIDHMDADVKALSEEALGDAP